MENLRQSILAVGVLEPAIFLHGLILDGEKRKRVCDEHAIDLPEVHFLTPEEAAPILWTRHPDRCARLFPCDSITEAAELYKTDLAAVSHLFAPPPPIQREPAYWRAFDKSRPTKRYSVRVEPELMEHVFKKAKRHGWSRAFFVRIACAFALDNFDQIIEFARLEGGRLRYRQGPKGPTGPKVQRRERPPKPPKWPGQP